MVKTDPSIWDKYESRRQKLRDEFLFIKAHSNKERKRFFKVILRWLVAQLSPFYINGLTDYASFESFFSVFPMCEIEDSICYTVKEGDTLSKIALEHNTTVEYIATMNFIENVDLIYTGQVLII